MFIEDVLPILNKSDKYNKFHILEKPAPFKRLLENQNFDYVALHSLQTWGEGDNIIGYVGEFEWKDNKVISLDGDSYYDDFLVYGYLNHIHTDTNEIGLEVLVGDDW